MGNSLQEQLLKVGLVDEHKLKQSRSSKRKQVKQDGGARRAKLENEARQAAERQRLEKLERDRELNRQRQEEAALRAAENEVRQLIHAHRVVRERGDLAFNFSDGTTLKRIYVNQEQHAQLVAGGLAIVRQDTFYEVVPAAIAERILARDPGLILVHNKGADETHPDDPYAEYQVPDDLMW
ncbi:nucleoprotein/polynucleotide-associated enzyme [Thiocapsa imhoffii]|uniref:Nucleoprotein/polynucleotide-associated enzyme n=1 Tax=Thiocapsa imhoffii TaxID=382777 RepID=A0A9X0WHN5_9GAMM|nr:nucleoprotein/polynucleotide-associated enzyme [Thiocapsa imhoffii]